MKKDYFNKNFYEVELEGNKTVCFVVNNMHFFGDYEASNDGEVVVASLHEGDKILYSLTGDDEFDKKELAKYAIEWAESDVARQIVAKCEGANSFICEMKDNERAKSSKQYIESQKIIQEFGDDYQRIINIRRLVPYLNKLAGYEENDKQKVGETDYMCELDRNNFKSQFWFIYENQYPSYIDLARCLIRLLHRFLRF